jgi:hypothetical protein
LTILEFMLGNWRKWKEQKGVQAATVVTMSCFYVCFITDGRRPASPLAHAVTRSSSRVLAKQVVAKLEKPPESS